MKKEIAYVINCGLSVGLTILNARIGAIFPTTNSSRRMATGHIILSSPRAIINTLFVIPPVLIAML